MSDTPFAYQGHETLFGALLAAASRFGRRTPRWEDMKPGS